MVFSKAKGKKMSFRDYWKPQFKYQFVEWFVQQGILTFSKANKMRLKNLKGKYFEIRTK